NYAQAKLETVGIGAIAAGATISEAKVGAPVTAKLDGDITSSGSITVRATSDNYAIATTIFITAGLGALSATDTQAEITSTAKTEALVGSTSVNGSTGLVTVTAGSANSSYVSTNGGTGGVIGITVTLPTARVAGATRAIFGGSVTGGTGLTAQATSNNDATVESTVIGVALAGASLAKSTAIVDGAAVTEAGVTGTVSIGGGTVSITSTSDDDAMVEFLGVSVSAIGLGITLPTAEAKGETRAFVGEGANVTAGALTITASGVIAATAIVWTGMASAIGGGLLQSIATAGGIVEAFIGARSVLPPALPSESASTSTTTVNVGSGAITVTADADIRALAEAHSGSIGLLVIGVMLPTADASGITRAYVRDNVDIDAGALTVRAGHSGDRVQLDARSMAEVFTLSIAGGAGVTPEARVTGVTEAFIGAPGGVTGVNTDATKIQVTGAINVQAFANLYALSETKGTSIGAAAVNVLLPASLLRGITRAYAGDGADVDAGSLSIAANAIAVADATARGIAVSAVAFSFVDTNATVENSVEAYLGKSHDAASGPVVAITLAGPATLSATSNNTANGLSTG